MFDNSNQLPISGSILLSGLLYIGASIFILGPIVAERTIEKSDWNTQCKTALKTKIEASRKPRKFIPRTDCSSTLGLIMPELARLCKQYGDPDLGGFVTKQLRQQERLRQEAEERRLALAASQSSSQCSCAASLVAQDRIWAIHAGSLRIITPHQVNNLTAELSRALNSSHCAGRGSS